MTDWSDVRRDEDGDWGTTAGHAPALTIPLNRHADRAEWVRAAEFCRAVADALQAEAELEECEREFGLRVALCRLAKDADAHTDVIGAIIRTVREHDA